MSIDEAQAASLRKPFDPAQIGQLPKGGTNLDYVGHAAVTDRLLQVDPNWFWEPLALDPDGGPLVRWVNKDAEMWIRLTICGHPRIGVGCVTAGSFELGKQLISDAIRNAAMRFGVRPRPVGEAGLARRAQHPRAERVNNADPQPKPPAPPKGWEPIVTRFEALADGDKASALKQATKANAAGGEIEHPLDCPPTDGWRDWWDGVLTELEQPF